MLIKIPKLSLVVLIGPSGSGKTTFAHRHFLPSEVLSSDACRAMVADNENDQLSFIHKSGRGLGQPALKCRGREYFRIIYGPEYTNEKDLVRLRSRGLGRKRSLALSEFALGLEALDRFVRHEPLRKVHECVFGVLALESEPVDPRL
jgi:hypothetical protein